MASSNRHWPSLFKAKPCNSHLQWQHDINSSSSLLPGACQKAPYSSAGEERSPEPKPRWNPKPEQIRILEAIFNSGMVNPPRDEIRRIRAQLQEYGQVGDANVFYWFQNRKSRSKHKQRHLQSTRAQSRGCSTLSSASPAASTTAASSAAATSSSSSSSEPSSTGSEKTRPVLPSQLGTTGVGPAAVVDVPDVPPVAPVSLQQGNFFQLQTHGEFSDESLLLLQHCPQEYFLSPSTAAAFTGLVGVVPDPNAGGQGLCNGLLTDHHFLIGQERCKSDEEEASRLKTNLHQSCYGPAAVTATVTTPAAAAATTTAGDVAAAAAICNAAATTKSFAATASSTAADTAIIDIIHGMGAGACGATRSMVFINGVAFEVGMGPLNVREAFGEQAVLLHCSGHPVLVDEWGITLHPLQPGASYYLV